MRCRKIHTCEDIHVKKHTQEILKRTIQDIDKK